jgi:hypothetical protein
MNFLFTTCMKNEVTHQVVFLEQTILKKSTKYKCFVILLILYSLKYISCTYFLYVPPIYFHQLNISNVKTFIVNDPADIPLKYISYLMERLLSAIPSKHIKCTSKSK